MTRTEIAKYLSGFVGLLLIAINGAQASGMTPGSISSKLVSNRMLESGSWMIDEEGKGEVRVTPYSHGGIAFANRDTGVGAIRFAEGVHSFNIGPRGYAAVRAELMGILEGKPDPLAGIAIDCGIEHPGYSEVGWNQNHQTGSFRMDSSLCTLPPEIDVLRVSEEKAWLLIGRLMLRYGQAGVSEELKYQQPLVRPPYTLSMRYVDVMPNVHIDWEVRPNGKGWFQTNRDSRFEAPYPNAKISLYVVADKHIFDIGEEGYLVLRRELDAYILGTKGAKDCPTPSDDGPIIQLRFALKGKQIGERSNDDFCVDNAERLRWVNSYLGARVAATPVTVN